MKTVYTIKSPPGLLIMERENRHYHFKLITDEKVEEQVAIEIQEGEGLTERGYEFNQFESKIVYPGIFLTTWWCWDSND